jgi:hypothetical protein
MIIMLQYWTGDEAKALTLARLLADLERGPRKAVYLVLARAFDCNWSEEAEQARVYCSRVFTVIPVQSSYQKTGHPDGAFGIWAGALDRLYVLWNKPAIPWHAGRTVFCCEADGVPLRQDWLDRMIQAHKMTLTQGRRVTGAVMDEPMPHVNGNFMMDLQVWADYPSLRDCPPGVAWDLHHAPILLREARSSYVIRNEYNTRNWTAGSLGPIGREAAWLHGCKDNSVLEFVRLMMRTVWRAG